MKIMVIHLDDAVNLCPPVLNVIENLLAHDHKVFLLGYDVDKLNKEILKNSNFSFFDLGKHITPDNSLEKYKIRFESRKKVREVIHQRIYEYDYFWTTSQVTVREVGEDLLKVKHIMQLMELAEYVPMFGGHKAFLFDIAKYAQHAYKVVVPEINRAYILKTWWNLEILPTILPNKPYKVDVDKLSVDAQRIIERVKQEKRKIIYYQGGFSPDRKFDIFADAIRKLGDSYCLYFMGYDNEYRKEICEKYPYIEYLGFLNPPEHLVIAKYAHIGILTYVPQKAGFYSILNAQYCAPNKTYEYAYYGLPMIGTDVMGLQEIFHQYKIGCCIKDNSSDSVVEAVQYVENNYDIMKNNCKLYFDSTDLNKIVKEILE